VVVARVQRASRKHAPSRYERLIERVPARAFPVPVMTELVDAAFIVALALGTVLYGTLISRRVHDRRVQARIRESVHLYAVTRSLLAERRQAV
jgi:hypothetical protein